MSDGLHVPDEFEMGLRACRALDAKVRRDVFGEKDARADDPDVPEYSTDLGHAWNVARKLGEMDFELRLTYAMDEGVWCEVRRPFSRKYAYYNGDSPAHAICLASLAAMRIVE